MKKFGQPNILDLIHLSNIRLVGNDILLEREVYQYIGYYLKKRREFNK
ncbi:hypothetical protein ACQV2X_08585 [Facklamia sp. P12945]